MLIYDKAYLITAHSPVHHTNVIISPAAVQTTQSASFLFITADRNLIKLTEGHIKQDTFLVKLVYTT
jgi:hypothetical protein